MSLKAKLEAVIYAAEEPVTLAQLAMIFGNEAQEYRAELEAARAMEAAQNAQAAEAPANEKFDFADTSNTGADEPVLESSLPGEQVNAAAAGAAEAHAQGDISEAGAPGTDVESADLDAARAEPGEAPTEQSAAAAAEAGAPADTSSSAGWEAEARRAARQREREVKAILRQLLDEIVASYATDGRGIEIREIAGGFRMGTKPEFHDAVRAFVKSQKPPLKLSMPALETLAVIAYKQPVTAPEVNEIRGVDSSGVFGSLLARKLIATAGRKQVIGRPILYKTTREFLLRFGLKDISELPSMEEFEKMAASELDDMNAAEAGSGAGNLPPELDEGASEEEGGEAAEGADVEAAPESPAAKEESNHSEAAPRAD